VNPPRLLHTGSPNARAWLAAAKHETMPRETEAVVLAALGVSTVALASPLAFNLWSWLRHAVASKLGVGLLVAVGVAGGFAAGQVHERRAHTLVVPPVASVSVPTMPPAPTAPALSRTEIVKRARPVTAPTKKSSSFPGELAALQSAQAAISAGDAAAALDALDAYDAMDARGALTEEAMALRVRAWRLFGNDARAEQAFAALAARFPTSIYLSTLGGAPSAHSKP
jgi:hypothetical protein